VFIAVASAFAGHVLSNSVRAALFERSNPNPDFRWHWVLAGTIPPAIFSFPVAFFVTQAVSKKRAPDSNAEAQR
jgi:hypothetical protein